MLFGLDVSCNNGLWLAIKVKGKLTLFLEIGRFFQFLSTVMLCG
jgi:hypothetical protein